MLPSHFHHTATLLSQCHLPHCHSAITHCHLPHCHHTITLLHCCHTATLSHCHHTVTCHTVTLPHCYHTVIILSPATLPSHCHTAALLSHCHHPCPDPRQLVSLLGTRLCLAVLQNHDMVSSHPLPTVCSGTGSSHSVPAGAPHVGRVSGSRSGGTGSPETLAPSGGTAPVLTSEDTELQIT